MKTAIDWLVEQLEQHYVKIDIKNTVAFQQAKQMEKEQIMNAHNAGACNYQGGQHNFDFFQENDHYYHEVYFVKP